MEFESPSSLYKQLSLTSDADFNEIAQNEDYKDYIHRLYDDSRVIIFKESFNDAVCPKCKCHTIASVVDEMSNKFISECVACKMRFMFSISS